MANVSITSWVPVDVDNVAVGKELQRSAIYDVARRRPVSTTQTDVPRYANADVNGGPTLTDDTNVADTVSMFDYLYNGKFVVNESEFEDSPADAIEQYAAQWMNSFHKKYDNACIGVTGARSGTATLKRPYTSIYAAVRANDSNIGYTSDTNYTATGTGGLTYANMNAALGKGEQANFWAPDSGVIIIHPGLLQSVRGILGTDNRPIFVESSGLMAGGGVVPRYNLFGYPAYFSYGAQTSSSFDMTEAGKKLVVFVNRQYLVRGDRIAPQTRFIPAEINTASLQHVVQARARQGFVLTSAFAASVLEVG